MNFMEMKIKANPGDPLAVKIIVADFVKNAMSHYCKQL
jgi:hypothetical protein